MPISFMLTQNPGLQTSVQASDTIGNTTTATLFGSSYTLPANALSKIGRQLQVEAWGVYGTSTGGHALTLAVMIGTTAVLTTGSISTTLAGGTSRGWYLSAKVACRTAGAGGAAEAQGLTIFGSSTLAADVAFMTNTAVVNLDWTQAQTFALRATWGTADPMNVIQMRMRSEEIMGQS